MGGRAARDDVLGRSVGGGVLVHLIALIVLATAPRDAASERDDDDARIVWMRQLLRASGAHDDHPYLARDPPRDIADVRSSAQSATASPGAVGPAHVAARATASVTTRRDATSDVDARIATLFASAVVASGGASSPNLWSTASDAQTTSRFYAAPLGPPHEPTPPSLASLSMRVRECDCARKPSPTTATSTAAPSHAAGAPQPPRSVAAPPRVAPSAAPPATSPTSRSDVETLVRVADELAHARRQRIRGGGARACVCP